MRRFRRPPLLASTTSQLARWEMEIKRCRLPQTRLARAKALWKTRSKGRHFHDVRDRLIDMNAGLRRCMYCEADRGAIQKRGRGPITAIIDHWKPIAHDPLATFDWRNLFLTCGMCNSILKGSTFPVSPHGDPQLLHPVEDDPIQEISFLPSSCSYVAPAGTKGHTTIGFFHLDDADLEASRRGSGGRTLRSCGSLISSSPQGIHRSPKPRAQTCWPSPFAPCLCEWRTTRRQPRGLDTLIPMSSRSS